MLLLEAILASTGEAVAVYVKLPLFAEERGVGSYDGINKAFGVSGEMYEGSAEVYLNGLKLVYGEHFSQVGSNEVLLDDAPQPGDDLIIRYMRGI